MSLPTSLAVYFTIWWIVLFAILPIGVQSYAEAGIKVTDGGDPGAPVNPNLKRKFITTSWVSAILFGLLWSAFHFHWLTWEMLPDSH